MPPSWASVKEAQMDVRLRVESIDQSMVDFVIPAHDFYNYDFGGLTLGRWLWGMSGRLYSAKKISK